MLGAKLLEALGSGRHKGKESLRETVMWKTDSDKFRFGQQFDIYIYFFSFDPGDKGRVWHT